MCFAEGAELRGGRAEGLFEEGFGGEVRFVGGDGRVDERVGEAYARGGGGEGFRGARIVVGGVEVGG